MVVSSVCACAYVLHVYIHVYVLPGHSCILTVYLDVHTAVDGRRERVVLRSARERLLHQGAGQRANHQLVDRLRRRAGVVEHVTRVVQELQALPPRDHRRGEAWGERGGE